MTAPARIMRRLFPAGRGKYYRVLDVGCGVAPLLPQLLDQIGRNQLAYRGIDLSRASITEATRRHGGRKGVEFVVEDIFSLLGAEDLPWFNVVLVQDVVAELSRAAELCAGLSKLLTDDGVLYIRSPIDRAAGGATMNRATFDRRVVQPLKREALFEIHVFESQEGSESYINLLGHKRNSRQYERHHYAVGFDEGLSELGATLAKYETRVNHFGDEARTFRHEGYLASMSEDDFGATIECLQRAVDRTRPGKTVTYMKDKLNIQHRGMRFRLHQDATANWNHLIGPFEFVTFGVPLDAIPDASYGGTRLVVRQGYRPVLLECSETSAIDPVRLGTELGRKLQYLNCLAAPGTYYMYDQYILHDSTENLRDESRKVLFISCILTSDGDMYSRDFSRRNEHLLETRPGLDIKRYSGRS